MPRKSSLPDWPHVMTDIRFDTLSEFAPSVKDVLDAVEQIMPVNAIYHRGDGEHGILIAFDQSLANTGYVVIDCDPILGVSFLEMGCFHTVTIDQRKSWDDTFNRSVQLFDFLRILVGKYEPTLILHETPPVGESPYVRRADSSIVTATVIRTVAALNHTQVEMVGAQSVKAYLTGNRNAKKKEVREALEIRFDIQLKTPGLVLNEHTFDALGIAVTFLEKK
jgi:Holliday junction resolvasome RuvABC endonuclease subunit